LTHVVMLVANDVSTDTRVKKEALTVARMGLSVTVVGLTAGNQREESLLGPVRVIRVPVSYTLRDSRVRKRVRLRQARPPFFWYRFDADRAAAEIRLQLRQQAVRDATARALSLRRQASRNHVRVSRGGVVLGRWRLRALSGRHTIIRGRYGAGRVVNVGLKLSWRAFDAAVNRIVAGAHWSSLLPEVYDLELALGPVVDELQPDVIHAHDMQVMGVAADACARAHLAGRRVPWIYDAHEYVAGLSQYGGRTPRVIAAWASLEEEHIRSASRIVTVSPAIAEALQHRYALPRRPAVVLNTPVPDPQGTNLPSVRETMGLAAEIPLVVYSGVVTHARGVHTAIEAMAMLPMARLVIVCVPYNDTWAVRQIRPLVAKFRVADRVHFINPVPSGSVVEFLRSSDVGLVPGLHFPSHEMSLTNKMFEYLNAGVPVVVSDCRTQAEFVRAHGIGEVFPAGNAAALASAIRKVLDDHSRYARAAADRELLDRYSWRRQEEVLRGVYCQVMGRELSWNEDGEPIDSVVLVERSIG
jgi:glycosyltransferase involved in cell wall biosynthesis